jgi:hypothetical protein
VKTWLLLLGLIFSLGMSCTKAEREEIRGEEQEIREFNFGPGSGDAEFEDEHID